MKSFVRYFFMFTIGCSFTTAVAFAQKKLLVSRKKGVIVRVIQKHLADSLALEISNTMFNAIDGPEFQKSYNIPAQAIFKVSINSAGKVTDMRFSDSADSLFLKAYSNRKIYHNDKLTFERYAKVKRYKNLSLLILVNFLPRVDLNKGCLSYKSTDSLFKFNNEEFAGPPVFFETITVTTSKINM